jgi:hypothetical protein
MNFSFSGKAGAAERIKVLFSIANGLGRAAPLFAKKSPFELIAYWLLNGIYSVTKEKQNNFCFTLHTH